MRMLWKGEDQLVNMDEEEMSGRGRIGEGEEIPVAA